jgi:hypothetical protein
MGIDGERIFCSQRGRLASHYEVEFGLLVGHEAAVGDAQHAELIPAVAHAGAGFYLHAPKLVPTFHHEVVAMHLSVGLGDQVAEAHGFVDECHFAKIASASDAEAACQGRLAGKARPRRSNASGVKQPWLCPLVVRKRAGTKVPGKRKGASCEACAKLDLYFQVSRFEGVNPPNFQMVGIRSTQGMPASCGRAGQITAAVTTCCGYLSEGDTNLSDLFLPPNQRVCGNWVLWGA